MLLISPLMPVPLTQHLSLCKISAFELDVWEMKEGTQNWAWGVMPRSGSPKAGNFVLESQFSFMSTFLQNQPSSSIGFGDKIMAHFELEETYTGCSNAV